MQFLFPAYFKIPAVLLTIGGLLLVIFRKSVQIPDLSPGQVSLVSYTLLAAGLLVFILSRESEEDELVRMLRLQSFQFSAMATLFFILAGIIYELFKPGRVQTTIDVILFQLIVYITWFKVRLFQFSKKGTE